MSGWPRFRPIVTAVVSGAGVPIFCRLPESSPHPERRFPRWPMLLMALVFLPPLLGCPSSTSPDPGTQVDAGGSGGKTLQVVATTAMVGDVVRAVGGEYVDVQVLLGPGVDPHLHMVTRDDIAKLMAADMVFYSGLMLEGKMTDSLRRLASSKPVYAVTDAIPRDRLLSGSRSDGYPYQRQAEAGRRAANVELAEGVQNADPHVWFDVLLWGQTTELVAEALGRERPAAADEFQQAAEQYREELAALNEYARQTLESIPQSNRTLITSHDAFGYFGRAYGLRVLGVQGISTDSEAGLRRVNELVDQIVDEALPAVFIESSVPRKSIEALIDGARSRGHQVTIGGELYSDAAGPGGTYESTYIGMVDHNVTTIAKALGGDAPAGGMSGRLESKP